MNTINTVEIDEIFTITDGFVSMFRIVIPRILISDVIVVELCA